ncbi:hypothetical protein AQUCO_04600015v1 [Aquilegia coerulea]|nr:hypothetical protein AQUCO_04600015v1 [Aquilegia coerulea]
MPLLSGIGLLCKIMSHKTYKNIPVIMMSSHDSMVLVIKCLSKGAVDFLVKPIRKNELRNLWQHVWRRQQSSSDSGSGSFIHAQTYEKLKNAEESGNNTGSKDRGENCYSGLNNGDGSDNGSGTQSSWTRQGVEVNSPHPVLICDQTADHSGNTCAQVVFPKTEAFDHVWGHTTVDKSRKQEERLNDNGGVGKVLAPGNTIPNLKDEYSSEKYSINLAGTNENTSPGLHLKKGHDKLNRDLMEPQRENIVAEVKDQASDVICSITANTNDPVQTVFEASNGASKILKMKDKANSDSKVSLEPCSKRPRGIENATGNSHDDHHVLKLSNVSAFSRCASASTAIQAPITDMGSCSPLGNSSKAGRAKSIYNSPNFHLVPNEPSNICSNNINMDSRKQNLIRAGVFDEKSTLATKRLHPSSPLQSLEIVHAGPPQKAVLEENDIRIINILPNHPRALEEQTQVQQHCVQYRQRQKPPHSQDYRSSDDKVVETLQHKSRTVFCCRVEANAGKKFLSPLYSNCERNGQNRRTTNEDVRRMNINFENVVPGKSKSC